MNKKLAALTFDDGPSIYSELILDILHSYKIRATFFCVGSEVEKFPSMIRRMQEDGHVIGNHTWNHPDIRKIQEPTLLQELQSTNHALHQILGYTPHLFRPPYGYLDSASSATVKGSGLTTVLWNVNSKDWYHGEASSIYKRVVTNLKDCSIILLHDGDQHGCGPRDITVDALPKIIDHLLNKGYRFVTIPEFH